MRVQRLTASRLPALTLALTLGLVAGTSAALAQPTPPPSAAQLAGKAPAEPKATLNVGDKAPALNIEHWVKGQPVKGFEPGKVYVVEFWATWCAPCIKNMPHLTKLQKQYADKGVTIIGVSSQDKRGIDDVRPFVERTGDVIGYTIAVDKAMATGEAYLTAVNQNSIPYAFIVDKAGKLAWHGHPMNAMDLVLDEVVKGTFDPAAHTARMDKYQTVANTFGKAAEAKDWTGALAALDELKTARPDLARKAEVSRFAVLRIGKKDDAAAAEHRAKLVSTILKDDPETLAELATLLQNVPEPTDADRAAAIEVAQAAAVANGNKDPQSLSMLARAHKNAGQLDKAIEIQTKALDATTNPQMKSVLQGQLDEYKAAVAAKPAEDKPAEPKADPKPAGDK